MKLKKILSFALALAMVLAFIPAMSLTASAAEEQTLWDMSTIADQIADAEYEVGNYGLTQTSGYVRLNTLGWNNGTWVGSGGSSPTLTFFKSTSSSSTNQSDKVTFNDASLTAGAETITIDFAFAIRDGYNDSYQTWYIYDTDGQAFAKFYWDDGTGQNNSQAVIGGINDDAYYLVADNDSADDREAVLALRGVAFRVEAVKGTDGYTVTYSYDPDADGTYTTLTSETFTSINGIGAIESNIGGWSTAWSGTGMQDLVVTYTLPDTIKTVTVKYTVDDVTVATATGTYDTSTATSVLLDEQYYSSGNGSNVLYYAEADYFDADATVEMDPLENTGNYAVGDSVSYGGTAYTITGSNIVPNGDFSHGMNGWYSRANTTPPTNYSVTTTDVPDGVTQAALSSGNNGAGSTNSIGRGWAIESGTTYYYSLWVKAGDQWHGMGQTDTIESTSGKTADPTDIVGNGGFGTSGTWVKTTGVFTATSAYVMFFEGWSSIGVADVEIYPIVEDTSAVDTTINFVDGETVIKTVTAKTSTSLTVEAGEVYYAPETGETFVDDRSETLTVLGDGAYYEIPETTAQAGETINVTVSPSETKIGVIKDSAIKFEATTDDFYYGVNNNNAIRVASVGASDTSEGTTAYRIDADGNVIYQTTSSAPSTLGTAREGLLEFPIVDLEDGQTATLTVYVDGNTDSGYSFHGNGFSNGTYAIRFIATAITCNTWPEVDTAYAGEDLNTKVDGTDLIFSDYVTSDATTITFDVTDAMKAAAAQGLDTFDIKLDAAWGAFTMTDREKAVEGASDKYPYAVEAQEGKAAFIQIGNDYDYTVSVSNVDYFTVNGTKMSGTTALLSDGDYIYVYGCDYCYDELTGTIYDGSTKIEVTSNLELTGMSLGVELVDGAQIRIGEGLDTDDKITTDSGIRFIATVKTENTLAVLTGAEIGIAIWDGGYEATPTQDLTADPATYGIPAATKAAENYQGEGIFSLAITDIAEDNFNRIYVAAPYVVVNGETYYGAAVARTPYEVAAGILTTGTTSVGGYEYSTTESEALIDVLNAYANQTGARITLTSGYEVGYAEYANGADAFFTYSDAVDNGDGSYTITLTAEGDATFYDYADSYYRINNAKEATIKASDVFTSITVTPNGKTLEITFTPAE